MRLFPGSVLIISAATAVAQPAYDHQASGPASCQKPGITQARRNDAPAMPRKLNQLPSVTTYMAVHRLVGGCDAPLTRVEYRAGVRHH